MAGQYGVKETKEVLALGFALGGAWKNAQKDGKVSIDDLVYLLPAVQIAPAALADLALVPKEFSELDPADAAELVAYAKVEVDGLVNDEQAKKVVHAALKLGLAAAELIAVI